LGYKISKKYNFVKYLIKFNSNYCIIINLILENILILIIKKKKKRKKKKYLKRK